VAFAGTKWKHEFDPDDPLVARANLDSDDVPGVLDTTVDSASATFSPIERRWSGQGPSPSG
jgi:hypothetical protein